VPRPNAFDQNALAAVRSFADRLAAHPRGEAASRIEITLCGRGPIERLFAVEAALLAGWPRSLRRPAQDLVSSTGELGPSAGLTLRAIGDDGAEVLRKTYDIELAVAG
jgi:hypothetical protein